jgi:hypothetical protein
MLSPKKLATICDRLALLMNSDKEFGGLSVILCGDFYQLPPVTGTSFLKPSFGNDVKGMDLWRTFTATTVVLTKNYRARKSKQWRTALSNFRDGKLQQADLDLINSRVDAELPARCAYPVAVVLDNQTRKDINDQVCEKLAQQRKSAAGVAYTFPARIFAADQKARTDVIRLVATHPKKAENLDISLPCFVGMRVMVTKNVCVALGVANGARGTVVGFLWKSGIEVPTTYANASTSAYVDITSTDLLPLAILIKLDQPNFQRLGPLPLGVYPMESRKIPVSQRLPGGALLQGSFEQFPLVAAYAFTVWKTQVRPSMTPFPSLNILLISYSPGPHSQRRHVRAQLGAPYRTEGS